MKGTEIFVLIVLVIAIGAGLFIAWQNLPGKNEEFRPVFMAGETNGQYYNSSQFYPSMRYVDKKISYTISSECNGKKETDAMAAFSILSEKTILKFYPVAENGEIRILCSDISPKPEEKGHFIAGEGGPNEIINAGLYYVILSGKVSLFREEKCDEPKISLHEILHALGFDHNNNPYSVMYPVTSCDQKLDQYIIDEINRLYGVESAADLTIKNVQASKSGRYLNFHVEVMNRGLKDAKDVKLGLYAGDEKVKDFDFEDVLIGIKKTINVENLRIPSDTAKIAFVVYTSSNQGEIYSDNNRLELDLVKS